MSETKRLRTAGGRAREGARASPPPLAVAACRRCKAPRSPRRAVGHARCLISSPAAPAPAPAHRRRCLPPPPAEPASAVGARRQSKLKYIYRLLRPADISEALVDKTVRRRGRWEGLHAPLPPPPAAASSCRRGGQQPNQPPVHRRRRCTCCGPTTAPGTRGRWRSLMGGAARPPFFTRRPRSARRPI